MPVWTSQRLVIYCVQHACRHCCHVNLVFSPKREPPNLGIKCQLDNHTCQDGELMAKPWIRVVERGGWRGNKPVDIERVETLQLPNCSGHFSLACAYPCQYACSMLLVGGAHHLGSALLRCNSLLLMLTTLNCIKLNFHQKKFQFLTEGFPQIQSHLMVSILYSKEKTLQLLMIDYCYSHMMGEIHVAGVIEIEEIHMTCSFIFVQKTTLIDVLKIFL